jgi:hypothetical protein
MTIKKITRTFELTIEQNERFFVQKNHQTFFEWCPICENRQNFVLLEEIARRFEIKQREIFRFLEKGDLGFTELSEGRLLVCLECMNRLNFAAKGRKCF